LLACLLTYVLTGHPEKGVAEERKVKEKGFLVNFGSSTFSGPQIFDSWYLAHFCRSAAKFGSIRGLASRHLIPEFGELWSGVPWYHQSFPWCTYC